MQSGSNSPTQLPRILVPVEGFHGCNQDHHRKQECHFSQTCKPISINREYSHSYKLAITQNKCFPGKELNVIDTCFTLFLEDCRKLLDRDDVSNQLIKFEEIHIQEQIQHCFPPKKLHTCEQNHKDGRRQFSNQSEGNSKTE